MAAKAEAPSNHADGQTTKRQIDQEKCVCPGYSGDHLGEELVFVGIINHRRAGENRNPERG